MSAEPCDCPVCKPELYYWDMPLSHAATYTCPICGAKSFNPNDVLYRYCGACHQFEDEKPKPMFTLDELAIQMADWVDENIGGLSQRDAEGLEQEFKRLAKLFEADLVKRELAPPQHDAPSEHSESDS